MSVQLPAEQVISSAEATMPHLSLHPKRVTSLAFHRYCGLTVLRESMLKRLAQ